MTLEPDQMFDQAQAFLDFYIEGANARRADVEFPGSAYGGIRLRTPAVLDIRPEYEALSDPLDGMEFAAGEGPEESGERYLYLDRCPLQVARARETRDQILVHFIFVTHYPPGTFPERPNLDIPVRLPTSTWQLNRVAEECLSMVQDYLGQDELGRPRFGYEIEVMSLRDFTNAVENRDL